MLRNTQQLAQMLFHDRLAVADGEDNRSAVAQRPGLLEVARDLIASGREKEVEEIRDFISTIVSDPDANLPAQHTPPGKN